VPDEYLLDVPEAGSTMRARVVSVKPFGAFVHLPGYRSQGLVHISQLAARRVESVEEVAKLEDEVWVSVLSVEGEGRAARVSCSMRRVDQQTGEEIEDERAGGGGGGGGGGGREYKRQRGGSDAMPEQFSVHKGVVEKLESFGAFISLPGLRKNGLLHISQLSNQRIEVRSPHISPHLSISPPTLKPAHRGAISPHLPIPAHISLNLKPAHRGVGPARHPRAISPYLPISPPSLPTSGVGPARHPRGRARRVRQGHL